MNSTLVLGYGNPQRTDDGVGVCIAEDLEGMKIPGVDVRVVHQLTPELAADIAERRQVIFVDAALQGESVAFGRVSVEAADGERMAHALTPAALVRLSRELYGFEPDARVCSVRGENFEFGTSLSPQVVENKSAALHLITSYLSGRHD
jgi:hydrogenase maturation protease